MPLCKCLIINEIKYFLKFFLVVKERMPNFAIGNGEERPLKPKFIDIRKQRKPLRLLHWTQQARRDARNDLVHHSANVVSRSDAFLLSSLAGRKGTRVFPVGYAIPFRFDSGSDRKHLC